MPRVTAKALRKRFQEEVCFKKPLTRDWDDATKLVVTYSKTTLAVECGGKITKATSRRAFRKFQKSYQSLFFRFVNGLIKRDLGVKSGLFAAMGAGAQTLGEGHIYWMKDLTGDSSELQAELDALNQRQQQSAIWLQTQMRDFLLFYLNYVVSAQKLSALLELLRTKTAADEDLEWFDATELLSSDLKDMDARYLAEASLSLHRDEGDSLVVWCRDYKMTRTLSEEAGVQFPNTMHYELLMGQVTQKEMTATAFKTPDTEAQREAFDFEAFEAAVVDKREVCCRRHST